jgi:predicted ATPase/DNA-binding winged helix-turn-helix (wHTH) protein
MGVEANTAPASSEPMLRFGPFRIVRSRRVLLEGTRQVRLSSRAFDVLLALVDRAGTVVDKRALIASVWPNTVVEETNLRVHIKALRRALGESQTEGGYILNVPGRGYSFVGTLIAEASQPQPVEASDTAPSRATLPTPLTRMVGRENTLATLVQLLPEHRLVTIVGVGGVGKSTLALEVAARLVDSYPGGTHFVHLAAITNAPLVAAAIATEIGLTVSARDPVSSLVAFLKRKRMLLVLDNCEHVITAVAELAEGLLRGTEHLSILATSREPLGAEGEWQSRLQPLPIPPPESTFTAARARTYGAVELFVERAATRGYDFALTDANAPMLCDICRRLDGIPLAIELVAARLDLLGVQELLVRLNDRFLLSAGGRRTAAPRHQTLRAALEWSHELLTDPERVVLRRLAIFRGAFTVDSAVAVTAHGSINEQSAFDAVMSLTEKSLVATEVSEQSARHRLLHTTRAYAHEKLSGSTDLPDIGRWHAEHHVDLLRTAAVEWETMSRTGWVRRYGPSIDDVRAALDATSAPDGDATLGAELVLAAVPFGFQLALQDELIERIETVLRLLAEAEVGDASLVGRLNKAWQLLSLDARRLNEHAAPAVMPTIAKMAAADRADNPLGNIVTEATLEIEAGRYDSAVRKAQHAIKVAQASSDPMAVVLSERIMAQTLHFRGQHETARALARKVLGHADKAIPLAHQPLAVDHRVSMRIVLARIAWIEGSFYQARQIADESLEYAADDSPFSLCQALTLAACPIAFWQGDYSRARSLTARLLEEASRYRLGYWHAYGEWYERVTTAPAKPAVSAARFPLSGLLSDTLMTIDPNLVPERGKAPARESASGWGAPELLRVRGERLLRGGAPDAHSKAEALFVKAVETARIQGASGWLLRAATSLAVLWQQRGQLEQARQVLSAARARITQEHGSRDMVAARELLAQLA